LSLIFSSAKKLNILKTISARTESYYYKLLKNILSPETISFTYDHPLCFFKADDGDNVVSGEQADFQRAESASGLAPTL
jgi:hypothetical protein